MDRSSSMLIRMEITLVIEVRDDGNGIDVEAVKKKAIERGTITPEQAENMADKDVIGLLFLTKFLYIRESY